MLSSPNSLDTKHGSEGNAKREAVVEHLSDSQCIGTCDRPVGPNPSESQKWPDLVSENHRFMAATCRSESKCCNRSMQTCSKKGGGGLHGFGKQALLKANEQ